MAAFVARIWLAISMLTEEIDEPIAADEASASHPISDIRQTFLAAWKWTGSSPGFSDKSSLSANDPNVRRTTLAQRYSKAD